MEMEHEEAAPSLPSPTTTTTDHTFNNVEEEEKEELPPPPPLKGILKRSIHKSVDSLTKNHASSSSGSLDSKASTDASTTAAAAAAASRRMLFPSVEDDRYPSQTSSNSDHPQPLKQKKKTQFAPMARVIAVASRKDMLFIEKSLVWWQKSDYNDFKKTGRIIAKAMMEGGSEIWLTSTNNAWGRRISSGSSRRKTSLSRENINNPASSLTNKNTNTDTSSSEEGEDDDTDNFGNKWWCKFGHSRRGLEHIASIEEGRERQRNVNASIAAVIKEQQRQRMSGAAKDEYKLATSGRTYTTWARDLALAAGAADAE
eukprot:scaffold69889_cov32-Attheya_sp.AAC.1